MASLNAKPGSSSKRQHQTMVITAARKGIALNDLRSMVGGSLRALSSAQASDWIKRISGQTLPHPPGQKPSPRKGRSAPGVTRMISEDQCEQIMRLAREYFDDDDDAARAWLLKHFKVHEPRELATAVRGAKVIVALKTMANRTRTPFDGESKHVAC